MPARPAPPRHLRQRTGCSTREAKHRTRRAETLEKMPNVAEALSSGRLTGEHASALARAAAETSPEAVDRDAGLLVEASSMPVDAASTKVRDWVRRRQTDDDLQRLHQWQRRNRSLLFAAGEGGMIAGIAKFDRVSGPSSRTWSRLWPTAYTGPTAAATTQMPGPEPSAAMTLCSRW